MKIEIASVRPLADLALALEKKFDAVLPYEDAPYLYSGDIAQDEAGRTIPRAGRIEVEYGAGESLEQVVRKALEAHVRAGNPGVFEVRRYNEQLHLVPRAFRNAAGKMDEWIPLLDTSVTIEPLRQNASEYISSILDAVSSSRGASVVLGTAPTNALLQHKPPGTTSPNDNARSMIVRLFEEMRLRLSWQLLNQPGTQYFALNIHPV